MVDCGNPRCAQERRFFRKELLSWSKKVPLMIALEQIAANYSDKENSRHLANPYTSLELEEDKEDWEADDTCFYCQGQLTNSLDHLEEVLHDAKSGMLDVDNAYVRSLQDLLPFYVKHYTQGLGCDLLSELGSRSSYTTSTTSSSVVAVQVSSSGLGSYSQSHLGEVDDSDQTGQTVHRAHVELNIPRLQGRGRKGEGQTSGGNKRGYTEEELEAAVTDIRGGKLGTRRASALYGIPRSTLRNKIFKSGPDMDRTSAFLDPEDSNSCDEAMSTAVVSGLKTTDLTQSAFPYLPPLPFPMASTIKEEQQDFAKASVCDEFSLKLDHIRRMHNLKGDRDMHTKPAHTSELRMPLLTALIRRLVEQRFQMEVGGTHADREHERREAQATGSTGSSPVMPGGTKSMAISVDTLPHFLPYLPSFSPSCLALSVPSPFEDLRIPSYKPANEQRQQQREVQDMMDEDSRPFGKVYETSRIGETLKDIIVKSISEKMKFHDVESLPLFSGVGDLLSQSFPLTDTFPLDLGKSAFRSCRSEISQPTHPAKRIKREPCDDQEIHPPKSSSDSPKNKMSDYRKHGEGKSSISQSTGSSNSKSVNEGSVKEKKTRPKRGQYRKYNSQLLIEAVRAVQRGEMSVHRAGSYFGVPHSTLEYKVKERHLLRQKKPRESSSSSTATASTSATASSGSSSMTSTSITSSTTQTSKVTAVTSTASSDSSASTASSSSQTQLGGASIGSTAESSQISIPLSTIPLSSSSPSSPISALGLGLRKHAGSGREFPWFQPYLVSGASPFDPSLSLFPQGFALNTSASELLRKLQHKVQSKSSPSSPFSSESSFGFAHPNGSSSLRESFLLYN